MAEHCVQVERITALEVRENERWGNLERTLSDVREGQAALADSVRGDVGRIAAAQADLVTRVVVLENWKTRLCTWALKIFPPLAVAGVVGLVTWWISRGSASAGG